jgi:lipopolysaccharide export system protein LptA
MSAKSYSTLLALLCGVSTAFAQPTLSGKVSGGFTAPSSTDSDGRRHVIKGKEVEPRGNNLLELTEPRVTRYNPDDTPDMFMESSKCFYQSKGGTAYSSTNLVVRTADGRFSIEGVGWRWDLSGSVLTISNQVVALVKKAALSGATNSLGTNTIRITSKRFQQDGDAASFFDTVLVRDGDDTVRSERLDIQFVKPGGAQKIEAIQNVEIKQGETLIRSGRAFYDLKENIIRISEHPSWVASQREGSADLLVLHRAEDTLSATGHVYMKLPLTNLVLSSENPSLNSPGTNRFVEIRSERFDYQNARSNHVASALYSGMVRALQGDATLSCEQLTADFGLSNRLSRLHAERQVEMVSEKSRVFGREADYDLDHDKLVVQGEPRWEVDQMKGRSESLVFFPKSKEMLASRHVEVVLSGHSLGGFFALPGQTNLPAQTNSPLTVTAESLKRSTNISVFEKDVLVADARGTISCVLLTVYSGPTNQTERIIADQHVIIKQPNMVAYGDRAEYDQSTGLVHLTGNPELIGPGKHLRADEFIIDRNRNTFSVSPGKFRIQLQLSKGGKAP